jgi:hypothetical protein
MTDATDQVACGDDLERMLRFLLRGEWPTNNARFARVPIESTRKVVGSRWMVVKSRRAKGILLAVKHLPRLTGALNQALATSLELGLIPANLERGQGTRFQSAILRFVTGLNWMQLLARGREALRYRGPIFRST